MDGKREMEEQSKKLQRKKKTKDISIEFDKERLKVSILRTEILHIGNWKFEPTNEGDELVVKFFFVTKQLAWEVSKNGYSHKIEIKWSNIAGIRATLKDNEPGILQVELLFPPKFYKELKVDQRAHNKWVEGSDFTEDQASKCRMYLIKFSPGVLNEPFERLINSDEQLYKLSRSQFPTIELAYFPPKSLPNATQLVQPSNQIQQLTPGGDNLVPQTPAFGLPSHFSERMRFQDSRIVSLPHESELSQPHSTISSGEAHHMIIPIIGSSNNFQMALSSSWPQYSEVPNGAPNGHSLISRTNFNMASSHDLLNRTAYTNQILGASLSNGPTNSNRIQDRYILNNGPTHCNEISNDYSMNPPTHSIGAPNYNLLNEPTNSNGGNGPLVNGSSHFNGVSNGFGWTNTS